MAEGRSGEDDGGRRGYWRAIRARKDEILSVREEMTRRRGWLGAVIERTGSLLAHPGFFFVMLALHAAWLILNARWIPGVEPWDPYPFVMLATVSSVEAPFIALLVLMRQHRDQRIDELREEVSLQVNLHVEREATRTLRMLRRIEERLGIPEDDRDPDLDRMTDELDPRVLLQNVEESLEEIQGPPPGEGEKPAE